MRDPELLAPKRRADLREARFGIMRAEVGNPAASGETIQIQYQNYQPRIENYRRLELVATKRSWGIVTRKLSTTPGIECAKIECNKSFELLDPERCADLREARFGIMRPEVGNLAAREEKREHPRANENPRVPIGHYLEEKRKQGCLETTRKRTVTRDLEPMGIAWDAAQSLKVDTTRQTVPCKTLPLVNIITSGVRLRPRGPLQAPVVTHGTKRIEDSIRKRTYQGRLFPDDAACEHNYLWMTDDRRQQPTVGTPSETVIRRRWKLAVGTASETVIRRRVGTASETVLDLLSNDITNTYGAFNNPRAIRELSLSHNKILLIHSVYHNLPCLKLLDPHNQHRPSFQKQGHQIDLQPASSGSVGDQFEANQILLNHSVFYNLPLLEVMDLQSNDINNISGASSNNQVLDLQNRDIANINGVFRNNQVNREHSQSQNQILCLRQEILPCLEKLDLHSNDITDIVGAFSNTRQLILRQNQILFIPSAFYNPPCLELLPEAASTRQAGTGVYMKRNLYIRAEEEEERRVVPISISVALGRHTVVQGTTAGGYSEPLASKQVILPDRVHGSLLILKPGLDCSRLFSGEGMAGSVLEGFSE
ncbi:hypothetical protein Bbelb_120860 [Branchiostoma belcheri]|nr:hypothetical protein Bbelb_120860 [Branchiostoma belcheri]